MLRPVVLRLTVLSALAAFGLAAAPNSQPPLGLAGSMHDFTRFGVSEDQRCGACHVPSDAEGNKTKALWDSSAASGKRYKLYGDGSGTLGAGSLLCLSCHDGSSAIDAFGGMGKDVTMTDIAGGRAVIGKDRDLGGDHPIGVEYPSWNRDYRSRVVVEQEGYVRLPDGRVECSSCHDPHGQSGVAKLLVKTNVRSALCLTCHRK